VKSILLLSTITSITHKILYVLHVAHHSSVLVHSWLVGLVFGEQSTEVGWWGSFGHRHRSVVLVAVVAHVAVVLVCWWCCWFGLISLLGFAC